MLSIGMLFTAFIEFIFQQAAFNFSIVKSQTPFGAQSDFFYQLQIAGENIAMITPADPFEIITALFIERFQAPEGGPRCAGVNPVGSPADNDFLARRELLPAFRFQCLDF